jgi:hypothetical protein
MRFKSDEWMRTLPVRAAQMAAAVLTVVLILTTAAPLRAETVPVRYPEGLTHGFLRLRGPDGAILADGEMTQSRRGARVTSRLTFRFRDGSTYQDTTVFLEQQAFKLLTDHVVQRGPSFPEAQDMFIDARTGMVTVHYTDKGEPKVESEHLDLPPDVANGIVQTLLKNVRPDAPPEAFAYVAATPKPRLVKLKIAVGGRDRFATGRIGRLATHYVLKVDPGPVTGLLAKVTGKQPPDSHVWVLTGEAPAFLRAEQPFFSDGPLWRIELVAPEWR